MRLISKTALLLILALILAACAPVVAAPLSTPVPAASLPATTDATAAAFFATPSACSDAENSTSSVCAGPTSSSPQATPAAVTTPMSITVQTVVPFSTATLGMSGIVTATTRAASGTPVSGTVPGAVVTPGSGGITLVNDRQTIVLNVGQQVLLNLGEGYDWTVYIADQSVLSRAIGVMPIRGAQGVYVARQPGETLLTAAGNPTCRGQTPPCEMPSRAFQVNVVVK